MKTEEIARNLAECALSFRRFLEYVYISDPNRGNIKMEMWPHLLEAADAFISHRLCVVLKARQIGFSWLVAAFVTWVAMFNNNANVLLLSLGEREAVALLKKCKYIYKHLPEGMQGTITIDSATQFGLAASSSLITALPSTEDAGRSESATLVVGDEWDFHEYAEQNYAASKPTIDAGGRFIGISTRNIDKQNTFMVSMYLQAKQGRNNFYPMFYGCFSRPDRDEAWYEEKSREYSLARLRAEYPRAEDEALTPLEESLVFRDSIHTLKAGILSPKRTGSHVKIYHEFVPTWKYACGVDVAEGQGEDHDFSVAQIIGRKGLFSTVCATVRTNTLRPDEFARAVYEVCEEYHFPVLCYENNGLGIAFGQKMMELKYPRLYYRDENARRNKKPGLYTSRATRKAMVTDLASATVETLSVPDRDTVDEMTVLQWVNKGTYTEWQAPKLMHDDTVMSLAIANTVLETASSGGSANIKRKGRAQRPTLVRT